MNIFLLSIIEKKIGRVMARLSQLRHSQFFLESGHHEILLTQAKMVIDTYIRLFRCVNILPSNYYYNETTIVRNLTINYSGGDQAEGIDKKLLGLIVGQEATGIIPINIHISNGEKILLYLGIGIIDGTEKSGKFFIQELSIPDTAFNYSQRHHAYLEDAINNDMVSKVKSLRMLVASYGKNYNHFQKDCKEYFGDTFHQFQNKLRMIDVIEDILFTRYSFKEIAYRHNFSGYNSMYILFHKKYHFSLDSIPRFKTEN